MEQIIPDTKIINQKIVYIEKEHAFLLEDAIKGKTFHMNKKGYKLTSMSAWMSPTIDEHYALLVFTKE